MLKENAFDGDATALINEFQNMSLKDTTIKPGASTHDYSNQFNLLEIKSSVLEEEYSEAKNKYKMSQ